MMKAFCFFSTPVNAGVGAERNQYSPGEEGLGVTGLGLTPVVTRAEKDPRAFRLDLLLLPEAGDKV